MNSNNGQWTLSRRSFLQNACLAACLFSTRSAFADDEPSAAIVDAPCGSLKGDFSGGVRVFKGVPFAAPPVGPLRFKAPIKLTQWTGRREATKLGAAPMQEGSWPSGVSEDCLYLNIWAPQGKGPFPVYVWIHGGGLTGGFAGESTYDGTLLAQQGIVCITVAYRLGVFGFLDLEPLLGPAYAGSANNALRDLTMALEWIHENVAAFGGDPGHVTIGGQSAGAKLTGILMGVPSARPYFHQMISESGGGERVLPRSKSADVSDGFGQEWRTRSGQDISSLLTAPAAELIKAQHSFMAHWPEHFPLRPAVDGDFLPSLPVETIAGGSTHGKRLLIGTNRDESALFIGPHPSHDPTAADLANLSLQQFTDVYQRYHEIYPDLTVEQLRIRALTAEEYYIPSMRLIDAHKKGGGTAWMYRLDFSQTSGDLRGYAYHALEIGLVWNRPNKSVANAADEVSLATRMSQAWAAFIRGESPSAPGLPSWPKYDGSKRPTMIFDTQSHVDEKPQQSELRLWDGVL